MVTSARMRGYGAVWQGVAAAETDADAAQARRVDSVHGRQKAGRVEQVLQLAGRVLVLPRPPLTGAEPAMVEDQRREPSAAQARGVVPDDLLFHA